MSNRKNWEFQYTASDLAKAAYAKKKHHEGRLEYWKAKQKEVVEEVKKQGLEVSESLASMAYSLGVNNGIGGGARLVVKDEYQTQLNECHSKTMEHSSKVTEYDGWIQMLEANSHDRVSLDIDDYLFFYGK